LQDWSDLLAVDKFRDSGAAVPDQSGDLLERYPIVGKQGDEAVAQLARCPGGRVESLDIPDGQSEVPSDV
jgi:hypothetical protein